MMAGMSVESGSGRGSGADAPELFDWVIESQRTRRSLSYWVMLALAVFSETPDDAPEVIYTLRNTPTGERWSVLLPGDHGASALAAVIHARNEQVKAAAEQRIISER